MKFLAPLESNSTISASQGVVTLTSSGTPSSTLPDGALAVDTINNKLFFRSGSLWREVTGGEGAVSSVAVSDAPPASPTANGLWFDSSTGTLAIFYDSTWVEVASAGPQGPPGPLGAFAAAIRSDQQGNYSYMGAAPEGSADAGAVWRITRILLTSPFTTTVASDVAWTDRTTATYA